MVNNDVNNKHIPSGLVPFDKLSTSVVRDMSDFLSSNVFLKNKSFYKHFGACEFYVI